MASVRGSDSPATVVEGRRLKLSNLDKVLYPAVGFTKAQVIDYYVRISPALLPHLRDRPLTMKRYPEGVDGEYFYEKQCPSHRPRWLKTAAIWSEGKQRDTEYCLINDLPSLVWAANLADLELHTSLSLAKNIHRPTMAVFDLDPGEPANIVQCCKVALYLREHLEALELESYAKTSGSKGLQIYVPLSTDVSYQDTKPFARAMAEKLEREHRELIVSKMQKSLRAGKVFVDWSQNDEHKTTVCVYSLRAKQRPMVSTPVSWAEVASAAKRADPDLLAFDAEQALRRVEQRGDLFAPLLKLKQRLPGAASRG
ncbi:MAG TPA: non-homologous end-joining DNA ligase [Myxococcaceae bacterium]|nr:non-homologous end-joining DNA ligase [Myxococcaceae bacterium]